MSDVSLRGLAPSSAFYPATPDGWLVKGIMKIMREEGERVRLNINVVEESGTSLGSLLTSLGVSFRTAACLMWSRIT